MSKLLFASFFTLMLVIGCDDDQPKVTVKTKPIALGIKTECVLCVGHEIDVMSDTPASEYDGKKYYFCSAHCKKAFDKDPAAAIVKNDATTQLSTQPSK